MAVLACIFALLGCGIVLVLYGTVAKNRWGINLDKITCPQCGASSSMFRKPQSIGQALWGGHTCSVCGSEVDKWGRQVIRG